MIFFSLYICRYPDREQLQSIYSSYLKPVLQRHLSHHAVWGNDAKIHALAGSMVQVYENVRKLFTVDDYSHYLFTPRDLTSWVLGLLRYDLSAATNDATADHVLEVWMYEANRLFRDRLVGSDGLDKFDNIMVSVVRNDWSSNVYEKLKGNLLITVCSLSVSVSVCRSISLKLLLIFVYWFSFRLHLYQVK